MIDFELRLCANKCLVRSAIFLAVTAIPTLVVAQTSIHDGERLSDWMQLQQVAHPYWLGLQWQVPQEQPQQLRLKSQLLAWAERPQATATQKQLAQWLRKLPATGRVVLSISDARWLQGHPDLDPILRSDQQLVLPTQPHNVTVVLDNGSLCQVPHSSMATVHSYLQACRGTTSGASDTAWIAQPDGRSVHYGIATWNQQPQEGIAPGAWIWAPTRASAYDASFSEGLVRFLATQGPTADADSIAPRPAPVLEQTAKPLRDSVISASDFGEIGLLQTPSARMAPTGDFRTVISNVQPYTRANIMFQPLDWLETGFRYTSIDNRDYGPLSSQAYKDKSLDLKVRLARESAYIPELAVGIRDVGGTGLFSGEYFVGNKRTGDFDWSLGLGWGYLGARGNLKNPLSVISSGFATRPTAAAGQGGTFDVKAYFHGPSALFGGVQWNSPWDGLIFKLERDGNNYQNEPLGDNQLQRTPWNLGMVYRYSSSVDFSIGIERGTKLLTSINFHNSLSNLQVPKLLDPVLPPVTPAMPVTQGSWSDTANELERFTGWKITSIEQSGSALYIRIADSGAMYRKERIERLIAVLHRNSPSEIRRFVLEFSSNGMDMAGQEVNRTAWVTAHTQVLAPSNVVSTEISFPPPFSDNPSAKVSGSGADAFLFQSKGGDYSYSFGPSFSAGFGGVNAFILYQAGVQANATYHVSQSTWLDGSVNERILDNYSHYTFDSPSLLPHVRTDVREYVEGSRFTIPNLQITSVRQIAQNQFVSAYAGLLEPMFAGFGGEWMYRPWRSPIALGVDLNHVYQRGFKQNFSLLNPGYQVNTGHATLYWDTGWNGIFAKLSAGQYLAGDRGVTLDLSRRFANGVTLGAYATKTNVSAAQNGEGSFDKVIYLSLPFDALLLKSSNDVANVTWEPITRDAGQKLARSQTLFNLTSARDSKALLFGAPASDPIAAPGAGEPVFESPSASGGIGGASSFSPLSDIGTSAYTLGQQLGDSSSYGSWLTGAGLVLGARLLDKPVDRWALNHQGSHWHRLGDLSNGIPVVAGGVAAALAVGMAGDEFSQTGWTALKSAGFAVASNTALHFAIGRARPSDNLGPGSFSPFSSAALSSSFPSNHVATAFAVLTPFAQQYDMPWMYGLAAASAFGRIQQRQHWTSDVVAGGVVGYAVGSLLWDQQRATNSRAPRVAVGPRNVTASWDFN